MHYKHDNGNDQDAKGDSLQLQLLLPTMYYRGRTFDDHLLAVEHIRLHGLLLNHPFWLELKNSANNISNRSISILSILLLFWNYFICLKKKNLKICKFVIFSHFFHFIYIFIYEYILFKKKKKKSYHSFLYYSFYWCYYENFLILTIFMYSFEILFKKWKFISLYWCENNIEEVWHLKFTMINTLYINW